MTKDTLIRTICLALALINQVLAIFGKSPIPISDDQVALIVSTGATIVFAVRCWWKNNSITKEAIMADEMMHQLKDGRGELWGDAE